jgi:hypothetical protein
MALKQHNQVTLVAIVSSPTSPSFRINSNSSASALPDVSLYDNSTYGIKFQSPSGWEKIEILAGRITLVQFTSPTRNVTAGIQLPAQVVISIGNSLGNVNTLEHYLEAGNKLLHATLGN